jgi:hypothetical protein
MVKKRVCESKLHAFFLLFLCSACIVVLSSQTVKGEELDPALQQITHYKFGDNRENLTVVSDLVKNSFNSPENRMKLEKQFVSILTSDATYDCKDFICRQLWIIGTKESVPVLSQMLVNEKFSDMARYALEKNLCPEAGKALIDALKKAQGKTLIGIINSLGERREIKSDRQIAKFLVSTDETVASAAACALGKIGSDTSIAALEKAKTKVTPTVRYSASQALLYIADSLMQQGKKEAAADIFRSLCSMNEPKQVRKSGKSCSMYKIISVTGQSYCFIWPAGRSLWRRLFGPRWPRASACCATGTSHRPSRTRERVAPMSMPAACGVRIGRVAARVVRLRSLGMAVSSANSLSSIDTPPIRRAGVD